MPFWRKGSPSSAPPSSTSKQPAVSPVQAQDSQTQSQPPPQSPNDPQRLTRDELADIELRSLLSAIDQAEDPAPPKASEKKSITSTPAFSASERTRLQAVGSIASEYPTTMNCLHAFDKVWYCYSLGGQFLNVYRYGALRDCSEQSADWRFCMKTKMYSEHTRKAMILARYREKAAKYKKGPSSEDVWSLRTEPVDGAFTGWLKSEQTDAEAGNPVP
ncbi:hypothetical protein BDZ91DRAFT_722412 [Kalaharituber pfeilii]|nr:hypothetical protein BDZ91DRAFT_722412 [Kalaharituber pfeilii]